MSVRPSPLAAVTRPLRVAAAKADLKALIAPSRRGTAPTPPRPTVEAAIDALLAAAAGGPPVKPADVTGTWELAWTSEREVLWLIANGGRFGTTTGAVLQAVDLAAGTLANAVLFDPPPGQFVVDSSASVDAGAPSPVPGALRVSFRFNAARLDAPFASLPLPPFGAGWFDNVYVDGDLRVARDVRGDTLICRRAGPPRSFPPPPGK
jgi:hypothetical protein